MNGAQEFVCLLALPVSIVVNAISNEQNDDRNNEQELKSTAKTASAVFAGQRAENKKRGKREREGRERERERTCFVSFVKRLILHLCIVYLLQSFLHKTDFSIQKGVCLCWRPTDRWLKIAWIVASIEI